MRRDSILTTVSLAALLAGTCLAGRATATPAPQTPTSGSTTAPAAKTQTTTPQTKTGTATSKTGTAKTGTTAAAPLTTQKQKASYAIGINIGKSMKKDGVDVDPSVLLRGLRDGLNGAKPALTDEQAQAALLELRGEMTKKAEAERAAASATNKKEGDAFLAENKTKEGVKTTADGLQYKVIKEGTGPKPTAADTVTVNYKGTLISGKEFDSSYKRGQPATFPVGQIIKGWTEALQLMPVGSKWELFIPADLAYGDRGAGPDIGPNSTLIFEVELLSIAPKSETAPKPPTAGPQGGAGAQPQPQTEPQKEQPQAQPQAQPQR